MLTDPANASAGAATPYARKLIEVALPLAAINAASAREKSLRHGHPSTLHLWWARRPLAACRAVLFASFIDDPSAHPELFPTATEQNAERRRLFDLLSRYVVWENSNDPRLRAEVAAEIRRYAPSGSLPPVYDPFSGGGAIPIESQRLGLETFGSDINPVAVLITKALTEIPWRFRDRASVHPSEQGALMGPGRFGANGLALDVERYGTEIFQTAKEALRSVYPPVRVNGRDRTAISWLWTRTIPCPNPLCGTQMPLVKSFAVCTRPGKKWSIEPVVDREAKTYRFATHEGAPRRAGTVNRRGATCIVCDEPVPIAYIRTEAKAGRMGARMLCVVAEGDRGRLYLGPSEEQEEIAASASPAWSPDAAITENPRYMSPPIYGMTRFRDLFTKRQLTAMTALSDAIKEMHPRIYADAIAAGYSDDPSELEAGGNGAVAYATAVTTYLALALDRLADYSSSICSWHSSREMITHVFTRQTLSMTWDFAEVNPFSDSSGNFRGALEWVRKCVAAAPAAAPATIIQGDAAEVIPAGVVFSTDPPYYDNVPYADLSDFFYVWLRATIGDHYPDTLSTLLVPKAAELVADPARFHGDRDQARGFFESGLRTAFARMRAGLADGYPATIYYAFKQSDQHQDAEGIDASRISLGWETMLAAVIDAGFTITGTWPLTSEMANRTRALDSNALASSIVLVCRPRPSDAPVCDRSDFVRELRAALPNAIEQLRDGNLAATDLQQAALGPGMAIFSAYARVLEADDTPMTVRSALALITAELGAILYGDLAEVDAETHFAIAWFADHGYETGRSGEADALLRSKGATSGRLVESGVMRYERGETQLLRPAELNATELPARLALAPAWSQAAYLAAALTSEDGGLERATIVLRSIGIANGERVKSLAYHLYHVADNRRRSADARDFNAVVAAWPDLERRITDTTPRQERLT